MLIHQTRQEHLIDSLVAAGRQAVDTFRQASCSDNPGQERQAKSRHGEAWPSLPAEQALIWKLVQGRTGRGRDHRAAHSQDALFHTR